MPTGTDDLNRDALHALMRAKGIDGYADLARRAGLDRTYVSRIMRGDRPAQPSTIVAFARAVRESTLAITGAGIDLSIADLVDEVPA